MNYLKRALEELTAVEHAALKGFLSLLKEHSLSPVQLQRIESLLVYLPRVPLADRDPYEYLLLLAKEGEQA